MAKAKKQKQSIEVFCRFREVGFHYWPSAPEKDTYLRDRHRHEFHFEIRARVTHNNRDIEFCRMKEHAAEALHESFDRAGHSVCSYDFGSSSCEMLAQRLYAEMIARNEKYKAIASIEVSEDGENGARVSFA